MNRAVRLEELEPRVVPSLLRQEMRMAAEFHADRLEFRALITDTTVTAAATTTTLQQRIYQLVDNQKAVVEKLDFAATIALEYLNQAEADGLPLGRIRTRTILLTEAVAEYLQAKEDLDIFQALRALGPTQTDDQFAASVNNAVELMDIAGKSYRHDARATKKAAELLRADPETLRSDQFRADNAEAKAQGTFHQLTADLAALKAAQNGG